MASRDDWNAEHVIGELERIEWMARSYQDKHRGDGSRSDTLDECAAREAICFMMKTDASTASRERFIKKLESHAENPRSVASKWRGVHDPQAFPSKLQAELRSLIGQFG